jgi:hypothetical protein
LCRTGIGGNFPFYLKPASGFHDHAKACVCSRRLLPVATASDFLSSLSEEEWPARHATFILRPMDRRAPKCAYFQSSFRMAQRRLVDTRPGRRGSGQRIQVAGADGGMSERSEPVAAPLLRDDEQDVLLAGPAPVASGLLGQYGGHINSRRK